MSDLELIVIGDEAFTKEELRQFLADRERRRAYNRKYARRPDVKERRRAYFREYARRRRAGRPYAYLTVDELHERIESYKARLDRLLAELRGRNEKAA